MSEINKLSDYFIATANRVLPIIRLEEKPWST